MPSAPEKKQQQRAQIALMKAAGLGDREIAKRLGVSLSTVSHAGAIHLSEFKESTDWRPLWRRFLARIEHDLDDAAPAEARELAMQRLERLFRFGDPVERENLNARAGKVMVQTNVQQNTLHTMEDVTRRLVERGE